MAGLDAIVRALLAADYMRCIGIRNIFIAPLQGSQKGKNEAGIHIAPEEAKRNIEKLKTKYDSGDFTSKDYYTELVSILRDYVTQRYGFSAKEMTSYELVEHLINVPEDKTEKNAS